jgi:allantoinase
LKPNYRQKPSLLGYEMEWRGRNLATVDMVIKGGRIVRSDGTSEAGIAIQDGRIVGILANALLPEARQVIDARGKVVMPGVIDPHVHVREPGHVEREDWVTCTQAAAAGGVTTILDMPNNIPPVNSAETWLAKRELAQQKAIVDFALFGGAGDTNVHKLAEQAEVGAVGFKSFLWPYPDRPDEFGGISISNDDALLDACEVIADLGLVLTVHAQSKPIVDHYTKKLLAGDLSNPLLHGVSKPILAETEANSRSILFAMETGVKLNIAHISGGTAAAPLKAARQEGYAHISGETCPRYLLLTEERLKEIGPHGKVNPPIRSQEEQDKLWVYVLDGTITTLGSDHTPHIPEHKEPGWQNILVAQDGSPAIQPGLAAMLTAVNHGRLDLLYLTELMSENVARLYGLYPQKGVIQVGSDADLVIVDMDKEMTIDRHKLYTKQKDVARLFEGWHAVGVPVMTILRGTVVMRDGEVTGEPGYGKLVRPM